MDELWIKAKEWFLNLGAQYGVDPVIFGAIYVGGIPFFMLSVAWLVRNTRQGKPIALPALSAGFFFISAYLYLLVAGRNIPLWVYAVVVAIIAYGSFTTYRSIQKKMAKQKSA